MKKVIIFTIVLICLLFVGVNQTLAQKKIKQTKSTVSTTVVSPIRKVNFKNFTYHLNNRDDSDTPVFKDYLVKRGKWEDSKPKYAGSIWWINVGKVLYGDLTKDGQEDALVEILSQNNYGSNGWQLESREYLIFTIDNENPTQIANFDDSTLEEMYKPFADKFDKNCEGVLISQPKIIDNKSNTIKFESIKAWRDECSGKKAEITIQIINGKPQMIGEPKLTTQLKKIHKK